MVRFEGSVWWWWNLKQLFKVAVMKSKGVVVTVWMGIAVMVMISCSGSLQEKKL
jgi:hypothetical protein